MVHFITINSGLHTPTEVCQITVRFKGHFRNAGPLTVELALFRPSGAQGVVHKFWGTFVDPCSSQHLCHKNMNAKTLSHITAGSSLLQTLLYPHKHVIPETENLLFVYQPLVLRLRRHVRDCSYIEYKTERAVTQTMREQPRPTAWRHDGGARRHQSQQHLYSCTLYIPSITMK